MSKAKAKSAKSKQQSKSKSPGAGKKKKSAGGDEKEAEFEIGGVKVSAMADTQLADLDSKLALQQEDLEQQLAQVKRKINAVHKEQHERQLAALKTDANYSLRREFDLWLNNGVEKTTSQYIVKVRQDSSSRLCKMPAIDAADSAAWPA